MKKGRLYNSDPIFQGHKDRLWYFWDETWSNYFGPFNTRDEAEKMLQNYGDNL